MKNCTKCGLFQELSAFSKSAKTKDGLQYHCKTCKLEYQRNNPKRAESVKKYYKANKQLCIARSIASQRKKPEHYAEKTRKWVANNHERVLRNRRNHYYRNAAKDIERVRRRQGRIKGALQPSLAHQAEIDGLYFFCQLFPDYEVDHIVPLNGKTVSGLHVLHNLQVLTRTENRAKGNKFKEQ
jgi:transcription elongation factor Elf1